MSALVNGSGTNVAGPATSPWLAVGALSDTFTELAPNEIVPVSLPSMSWNVKVPMAVPAGIVDPEYVYSTEPGTFGVVTPELSGHAMVVDSVADQPVGAVAVPVNPGIADRHNWSPDTTY